MNKVRIMVKVISQPPIDTPASITHHTVDVESEELAELLNANNSKRYKTATVIGGELLNEQTTST